jgi:hypothetical protein
MIGIFLINLKGWEDCQLLPTKPEDFVLESSKIYGQEWAWMGNKQWERLGLGGQIPSVWKARASQAEHSGGAAKKWECVCGKLAIILVYRRLPEFSEGWWWPLSPP